MKILSFSDWRAQPRKMIEEIIREETPDLILYAGDDLDRILELKNELYLQAKEHFIKISSDTINDKSIFNIPKEYLQKFKDSILKYETSPSNGINLNNCPFYYVNGNDDNLIEIDDNYYLEKTSSIGIPFVINIGKRLSVFPLEFSTITAGVKYFYKIKNKPNFGIQTINGISLYGSKCGLGLTSDIINLPEEYVDILLVHIPPLGVLDLSTRFQTKHIGSEKLLNYINKFQPKYVICGHSHMWGGYIAKIKNSTIINVSSHDTNKAKGNYALIDTSNDSIIMKSKVTKTIEFIRGSNFGNDNYTIYGSIKNWQNHDLLTLKNDEFIANLEKCGHSIIADRIRSLAWSKPKIVKKLSFDPNKYVLIDVETGIPKNGGMLNWNINCKLWLIGIYFKNEIYQFELPKQRHAFLRFISDNNITELVSWTNYDSKVLRRMKGLEHIKWMDACKRATYSIIWHSYKLHELYDIVFEHMDNEIIDGAIAGLYADHLINKKKKCEFCPSEESIKTQIIERNKKDLIQMYELCDLLWRFEEKNNAL